MNARVYHGPLQPKCRKVEIAQRNMPDDARYAVGPRPVLVVCPTATDRAEIPAAARRLGLRVRYVGEDYSADPSAFDALQFIERTIEDALRDPVSGIFASDDYPAALVAAVIADRLELPGPRLGAVLSCADKLRARRIEAQVAPEGGPFFMGIDAAAPDGFDRIAFPAFAKPAKGFLSLFAERVADRGALERLLADAAPYLEGFVRPFRDLSQHAFGTCEHRAPFIVEGLLSGRQVTVEGYIRRGEGTILAITDSVMYPGTNSFARFELPSTIAPEVTSRMERLALDLVTATGFDDGMFNAELMYDAVGDRLAMIEINPRMCPQFADLVEKVRGVNTYDTALAIAAGQAPPPLDRNATAAVAASFVFRSFADSIVRRVPDRSQIRRLTQQFPTARLRLLAEPGTLLSAAQQDRGSFRYAILNLGAADRPSLMAAFEEASAMLRFELEPV